MVEEVRQKILEEIKTRKELEKTRNELQKMIQEKEESPEVKEYFELRKKLIELNNSFPNNGNDEEIELNTFLWMKGRTIPCEHPIFLYIGTRDYSGNLLNDENSPFARYNYYYCVECGIIYTIWHHSAKAFETTNKVFYPDKEIFDYTKELTTPTIYQKMYFKSLLENDAQTAKENFMKALKRKE